MHFISFLIVGLQNIILKLLSVILLQGVHLLTHDIFLRVITFVQTFPQKINIVRLVNAENC